MLLSCLPLRRLPLLSLLLVAVAAGCKPAEEIATYTVPKPELIDPTLKQVAAEAVEQQTLGAIVVVGETGWFFKLTGPTAPVEAQQENYNSFIRSLEFAGQPRAEPKWKLPSGWTQRPGSGLRFATIDVPGGAKPLELTVIPLEKSGDDATYVLSNVNRWRDQLGLAAINTEELAKTTETIKLGDYDCTLVRLTGKGSGTMGGAPFAPFAGGKTPPPILPPTGSLPPSGGPQLSFTTPSGWQEGERTAMRLAAFNVADGDKKLEITVIPLGGQAGSLLDNVNRWRGQIQLPPASEVELSKALQPIDVGSLKGQFVELIGPESATPRETILGAIAVRGEQTWFIKLKGDVGLAEREKKNFEAFVKSLKIE